MGEISNDMRVNVRAVLISQEGGVLVSQFMKDYKRLVQKNLPYKNHGFDNLEDFFKAMPDVVRLEYSKKDMAYRVYGINDKDTYTPSWVEKSQKPQEERPKNRHHNKNSSVSSKSNGKSIPNGDDLIPDSRNRYSVVYPRSKTPDYTDNDVRERFKNTGNVCDVHMIERWIFVRYRNQDDARRAQQMYKDELDVRFTDGNRGKSSKDNTANNSSMLSPETQSFDGSFGGSFGGGVGGSFVGASSARTPSNFVERKKNESFFEEKDKTTDSNMFQVYIGNLAKEVTEVDLVDIIGGRPVTRVCIKRLNNGSKVVGFVSFTSLKDANDVIAKWNGTIWHGRDLLVRHGKQRHEGSKELESSKQSESNNNLHKSMTTSRKKEKSDDEKSISSISDNFNKLHVNPAMKDNNDNNIKTSTPRKIVCTNGSSLQVTKNCTSPLFVPTQVNRQSSSAIKKDLQTDTEDSMPALEEMMPELEEMMPELEEMMPELEDIKSQVEDSTLSSNGYVDQPTAVFVGNFPAGTTDRELYALFNRYGVLQVKMVNNALSHERGCTKAFVTLEGLDCAVEAILDLDQTSYIDRKLLVSAPHGNEMLKEIIDSKLQEYMSDTGSSLCASARTFSNRSTCKSTNASMCQDVTNMSSQDSAALLETFTHIMAKMTSRKPQPIEVGDKITLCVTSWLIEQFYFAQNGSDKHSVKELLDISSSIQNSDNHLGRPRGLGRCVALYMGQWYRAWILKIDDQPKCGNVKVFYVDYGNVSIIPWSNTRVVHSSAWDLPAQAKPIRIMGETEFSEKELVEKQLSVTVTNLLTVDKCPVFEIAVNGIVS
ncbi:hypothetical protein SNE40_011432 [Patella caerulea]|uniref:Uncharacterized protein n=1 Tax=Patella caerulea TaxID=87958 RepID=A0AAN8PXS9_PATCE